MSTVLAQVASALVVAAIGSLAVAVAAVVVVLAIVAVIVMVLRNNGSARRAAGGLGYDAQGPLGQPHGDSDAGPPWARQPGQPGQAGQMGPWQGGAQDFGAPGAGGGRGAAPPWGQGAPDGQPMNGAWGQPQQQPAVSGFSPSNASNC